MIKNERVIEFYPITKNQTIDSLIYNIAEQFSYNLLRIYHKQFMYLGTENQEKFKDITPTIRKTCWETPVSVSTVLSKEICGIQNYEIYNNNYKARNINYNTKDIKYSEVFTKLWDHFVKYREYELKLRSEVKRCVPLEDYFDIYPLINYQYFFGDVFPYLDFNIVRIGNMDYSFGKLA